MEAGHSSLKVAWLVLVTVSESRNQVVIIVQANNNQRFYYFLESSDPGPFRYLLGLFRSF
jgi:hypothetical protein